jgi:hypothetical protein
MEIRILEIKIKSKPIPQKKWAFVLKNEKYITHCIL